MSLRFAWSIVSLVLLFSTSSAWTVATTTRSAGGSVHVRIQQQQHTTALYSGSSSSSSWSITDDWDNLSSNHERQAIDENYNTLQALRTQEYGMDDEKNNGEEDSSSDTNVPLLDIIEDSSIVADVEEKLTENDVWLQTALDDLLSQEPPLAVGDEVDTTAVDDDDSYSQEITRMVRCNEDPVQLLYATGGAIAPLSKAERDDIRQLLLDDETTTTSATAPTTFFRTAVATMFERSASSDIGMDASDVAAWMQHCLGTSVTTFDPRVRSVLSNGITTKEKFHELYTTAAQLRPDAVWRDLRAHGIVGPNEAAYRAASAAVAKAPLAAKDLDAFVDECAFLAEEEDDGATGDRYGTASYKDIDMVPGTDYPLVIRDGEFGTCCKRLYDQYLIATYITVFIDEQSCIGCMQCVSASPSSFQMVPYNGRARAYFQRGSKPDVVAAVQTCPVAECMHMVSFDELRQLETARDADTTSNDHKHFGNTDARGYVAATPLHVSRRDSDANHRDSFYHFLKNQCFKSTQCPQRGCFDCPKYAGEGEINPYFEERRKKANHARCQHFQEIGAADKHRKKADL